MKPSCHHYWLIQQANGPTSHAVCKICRAERDFRNYPDEARKTKFPGITLQQKPYFGPFFKVE